MDSLSKSTFQKKDWRLYVYFLVLFCLLLYRSWILAVFGFEYTDNDQSIMWLGTQDYANGIFHEPRFYGQNYNSLLESFLALPFYWLGMPLSKALPLISTLLFLLPFITLSALVYKKRSKEMGIAILILLFIFPLIYDLLTTTSRGFVTGLAFTTGSICALFYTDNKKWWFIAVLSSAIGYTLNPNSVIVSIPCLFALFLINYRQVKFYLISVVALAIGLIVLYALNHFYKIHPNYVQHGYQFEFKPDIVEYGLGHLDFLLKDVMPVFWGQGWMFFVLMFTLSFVLYRQKQIIPAWITGLTPFLVVFTMGIPKVYDGSDWVFFPVARMFLGIPLVFALGTGMLKISWKRWYGLLAVLPLTLVSYKIIHFEGFMEEQREKSGPLKAIKVNELNSICREMSVLAKRHQIDLILIDGDPNYGFYNYACATCEQDFPNTLFPPYERRTWRLLEDEGRVYKRILILSEYGRMDELFGLRVPEKKHPTWFLVENNTAPTLQLIHRLGIKCRRFHVLSDKIP